MDKELLKEKIKQKGFDLIPKQISQLQKFAEMLIEYNQKFNLTALTEDEEIINKHFVDSFMGADFIKNSKKIIDIGSGAGFPSIPLKLLFKDKEFKLIDSLNKRIGFLNTAIEELKLNGISAEHIRIEEAANRKDNRECFDTVLARAVAPLNTLIEYSLPFLTKGGRLIAYKGQKVYDEIEAASNAINKLYADIKEIREYKLDEQTRYILVIEKKKETPKIYPRGQNKPKKQPL